MAKQDDEEQQQQLVLIGQKLDTLPPIPAKAFGDTSRLTRIVLAHNNLHSIPDAICQVWTLEHLNLSNNNIDQVPMCIDKLQRLKWLNLSLNNMSQQLPVTIGNLTDLVHLDLSSNCLDEKALPDNFFTLVRLQRLYLSDNSIKYIDSRFGGLNQLKILALRNNQISRISSQALQGLALLQELHLQANQLRFLPPDISGLKELSASGSQELGGLGSGILKLDDNPWILPIADQLRLGPRHVLDYVASQTYSIVYNRQHSSRRKPPRPIK